MVKVNVHKIKKALTSKNKEDDQPVPSSDLLSLGSALLNLACTGRVKGGIAKEDYALFVGDSQAGKTWLALTALAEAANNPEFDDYQLIYDNVENGAKMKFEKFWGKKMASRVRAPKGTRDVPVYSETVQEFYYNFYAAMKRGPCIYVLDSMDAIDDEDDIKIFEKKELAHQKGKKDESGSYGTQKAKTNSVNIKKMIRKMRKTRSILIIIAQTRDKIGSHIPNQKTRGGGRAIKFFAHVEIWLSKGKDVEKKVGMGKGDKGKKIGQQGIVAKMKVEKSRHTGREKVVEVPIYWSVGIDDVGSCINYLVDVGYWNKGDGGVINAKELGIKARREDIVRYVEDHNKERRLYNTVAHVWREIDKQLSIKRKKRYE